MKNLKKIIFCVLISVNVVTYAMLPRFIKYVNVFSKLKTKPQIIKTKTIARKFATHLADGFYMATPMAVVGLVFYTLNRNSKK